MIVLAIKDDKGLYYCGFNTWNKEIRKAKFYVSNYYAEDVVRINKYRNPTIVKVDIKELKKKKEDK